MSEATVAVIRAMNEAFNAGSYEQLLELVDPEAEITDHLPLPDVPPSPRGRDELRGVLANWREGFRVFHGEVQEYVDLGGYVVTVTNWLFISTDEGIETRWRGADAWEVRDGRVVWGQMAFPDRDAALEAVAERRRERGPA